MKPFEKWYDVGYFTETVDDKGQPVVVGAFSFLYNLVGDPWKRTAFRLMNLSDGKYTWHEEDSDKVKPMEYAGGIMSRSYLMLQMGANYSPVFQ